MKAAVLHQVGEPLRIEEVHIDPPSEREVAIRIVASGICHSDYSVAFGVLKSPMPVVLGHEGAGVVEAVGPGVTTLQVGDHVVAALTPSCGQCPMCAEDKPFLCVQMIATMGNGTMLDGTTRLKLGDRTVHQLCGVASFAERAVIPAGAAIKVPKDVPLETVCLVGCGVTTGVGAALNTAQVQPGTNVAVIGCGGVGLSIIQGARIAGATTIIAIDPVAEKRTLALSLGATHAIDPRAHDVAKAVREITFLGVHYAFEALGRIETIEQAWSLLRPAGTTLAPPLGGAGPGAGVIDVKYRMLEKDKQQILTRQERDIFFTPDTVLVDPQMEHISSFLVECYDGSKWLKTGHGS